MYSGFARCFLRVVLLLRIVIQLPCGVSLLKFQKMIWPCGAGECHAAGGVVYKGVLRVGPFSGTGRAIKPVWNGVDVEGQKKNVNGTLLD